MRKLFAWLGVAMLAVVLRPSSALADEPLKPYVVLMLDVSGSMDAATGSGPPSCGGEDSRLNHARCAINKIVNSYGDMVFALGRFRQTPGGTFTTSCDANGNGSGTGGDQCTSVGINCNSAQFPCNCNGRTTANCATKDADGNGVADCPANFFGDARGEMVTGLIDGNNSASARWTDFSCATCGTTLANDPEIWGSDGFTPLAGYMGSAHRYWRGLQATDGSIIFPDTPAVTDDGFDPIRNDPKVLEFLPESCDPSFGCTGAGCCTEQCRPYITIMLTDGDETCGGNAVPIITSMLQTNIDGRKYRIETKVIGFGVTPGDGDIEAYAIAGAGLTAPGLPGNDGFYVQNENELQVAISTILDDAIRTETCNNLDDDCDGNVDEDFEPQKNEACDNGGVGVCRRTGTLVCKADGTGLTCNAQTAACVNDRLIQNGVDIGPCIELCNNGLDDDCDGKVEEGCVICFPQQEQCNGFDDDCDGFIDEAPGQGNHTLQRPCDNGTCPGVETCAANCPPGVNNGFCGCTAQPSTTEICDGFDNNCDGVRDGFQQACSTMNPQDTPIDNPQKNPGHPSNTPNPANICKPGIKVCPANVGPPNTFGACSAEIKPCNVPTNNAAPAPNPAHPNPTCFDLCNGADDDCDDNVDEDFAPQDCSDNCNAGLTTCTNGVLGCTLVPITSDDTCDGIDDDCDGNTDEDFVCDNPPDCDCSDAFTCNGTQVCLNGAKVCQGTPISQESCDCSDNNCNGLTDEGNLCSPGSTCNEFCQCAFPCSNTEFPCPLGKFCKEETTGCSTLPPQPGCAADSVTCVVDATHSDPRDLCTQDPANLKCTCRRLCIADPCFNMNCPPITGTACTVQADCPDDFGCDEGQGVCVKKQVCQVNPAGNAGACVDACTVSNCAPFICLADTGECKADDCTTFPERCSANQACLNGVCVTNPCDGITCSGGQYCVSGTCVSPCVGVDCPTGERCRLGVCEPDPCGTPCPFGQACNDSTGVCVASTGCGAGCPAGQWCNPNQDGGECVDDPCQISKVVCPEGECFGGTCFDPSEFAPDGGVEVRVTAGGGGCNTGSGGAGAMLAFALMMLLWRSRRTGGRA